MNQDAIIAATKACIRRANKMFKVKIPLDISIRFMKLDTVAYCWWNSYRPENNRMGLQINKFVADTNHDIVIRTVIPHEVAHMVMFYKQYIQGLLEGAADHGKEWAEICEALGGIDSQYVYAFTSMPKMKKRDILYHKVKTPSGFVVYITKFRYKQIQDGKRFKLPQTFEVIGKRHVSKVPVKCSQLLSEMKLCYIHHIIQV